MAAVRAVSGGPVVLLDIQPPSMQFWLARGGNVASIATASKGDPSR